uniref:Uncharacterized protein n=1 Tax=viral metagenome TaxID=1070528 RepID=A0A6C0C027_9ZZZZ
MKCEIKELPYDVQFYIRKFVPRKLCVLCNKKIYTFDKRIMHCSLYCKIKDVIAIRSRTINIDVKDRAYNYCNRVIRELVRATGILFNVFMIVQIFYTFYIIIYYSININISDIYTI